MKTALKLFCMLILTWITLYFTSSAYSQTSVCELEKDKFCISYSYLRDTSTELSTGNFDRQYNSDNIKIGLDYGLTGNLKLSVIPDFRLSDADNSDIPEIAPSLGGQGMYSRPLWKFVNLLGVGSLRIQDSKHQLDEDVPHNVSLEFIVGAGLFAKWEISQNFSAVIFSDFYYEGQLTNIFNTSLPAFTDPEVLSASKFGYNQDIGLEAGLEFTLWKRATLIGKFRIPLRDNIDDGYFTLSIVSHYL